MKYTEKKEQEEERKRRGIREKTHVTSQNQMKSFTLIFEKN